MLRPWTRAGVIAAAVLLPGVAAVSSRADDSMENSSNVTCSAAKCTVTAATSAHPAPHSGTRDKGPPPHRGKPGSGPQEPPTATSTGWDYYIGNGVGILPRFDGSSPKPAHAKEATPAPSALAQQAVRELVLPKPVIHMNPDETHAQLVHVPTWIWIDPSVWKPVSKTATVPGAEVTATATPVTVTWLMGDGATVVCQGPGTPYAPRYQADSSSPDCGHTYLHSSAGQPHDAYPVTAVITWDVEWHGGGQQGTFPGLHTQARLPVRVAEAQALVNGS